MPPELDEGTSRLELDKGTSPPPPLLERSSPEGEDGDSVQANTIMEIAAANKGIIVFIMINIEFSILPLL